MSTEEQASALYLRQVFDHFLCILAKSAQKDEGTFDNPLMLTSVQEPHMLNAIQNKAQGKPYSEGAWIFLKIEADQIPRSNRRTRGGDRQTAGTPDGSRKSGSERYLSDDDSEHPPRRFKKIKREEDATGSVLGLQRILPPDLPQDMEMNDPTVNAAHDHPANSEEKPLDDDITDTESTLSNAPSSSSEQPLPDSTTPARPKSITHVSQKPPGSKRVQFVTMFDEAVPILQAILDGMPISPEDLAGHPNVDEKQAALLQWGQRKGQAVRLLGAMQKAYLSVMLTTEPEAEHEPRATQGSHSSQNENSNERERTLANDPLPSQVPHSNDMPSTAPSVDEKSREDHKSPQAIVQENSITRSSSRHRAGRGNSAKIKQTGSAKGKAAVKSAAVSSYRSRDDGFWAAFGY
ncbi:hypothetical protein M407DRAFT_22817 [Tulasnella calospora MUT 4182]|uniref:Uncharacterized protein n=1 Tax=Tulasnella calospora MUT 4182 TaxID=1051891 RepID=A0A0C3QBL0_9AGAM|nr:hypothetical protein M407DRAFT_22817 [Tulasnella calospora MUT 4182]